MGEVLIKLVKSKKLFSIFFSRKCDPEMQVVGKHLSAVFTKLIIEDAEKQVKVAIHSTGGKALFYFYQSAILFALGKSKEGILVLEAAMQKSPRLLKKMMDLNPAILQHQSVVDLVARFKKSKSI
jgi:hypothetical protein